MPWYHYIYNIQDGELERAQSFLEEQDLVKKGVKPKYRVIKRVIAFAMVATLLNSLRAGNFISLFIMLTNWTLWATLVTALLGLKLSNDPSLTFNSAPNMHALHHICYTIMIFLSPAVVTIYWGVVHEK